VRTPADLAVLITGTPCGPFEACLVVSNPIRDSGMTVWPIVVSTIAPIPVLVEVRARGKIAGRQNRTSTGLGTGSA